MQIRNSSMMMLAALLVILTGCQSAYYATMEQFGIEKRHLLRDNVAKAQGEQQQASEEFKDVLTRIKEMYGFDGGKLEKAYKGLKSQYETCEDRAETVRNRIADVEEIAADLFKEWDEEINQMANAELKAKSRNSLLQTKRRYERLAETMRGAEARLEPVLAQVRDYVLYLKHHLNAQAIGALNKEADSIEIEVGSLIEEMNASIREAETFLKDFE